MLDMHQTSLSKVTQHIKNKCTCTWSKREKPLVSQTFLGFVTVKNSWHDTKLITLVLILCHYKYYISLNIMIQRVEVIVIIWS